jgi:hypothetical protein
MVFGVFGVQICCRNTLIVMCIGLGKGNSNGKTPLVLLGNFA